MTPDRHSYGVPPSNILDLRPRPEPTAQPTPPRAPAKPTRLKINWRLPGVKLPRVGLVLKWPSVSQSWRSAAAFTVVGLVLISPLVFFNSFRQAFKVKQEVLGASTEAYAYLQTAKAEAAEFDFTGADEAFQKASDAFSQAQSSLDKINGVILTAAKLIPFAGRTIVSGEALIKAGQEISLAGQAFSRAVNALTQPAESDSDADRPTVGLALTALNTELEAVGRHINEAARQLDRVRIKNVPRDKRAAIGAIKDALPRIVSGYQSVKDAADVTVQLFGQTEEHQYLVVFQNSNELRPTGGFMGSLALIAAQNGQLRIIDVPGRGFLDINATLTQKIIAPAPLALVNPHWQSQDANWWPDWPTSAAKINWFYEQARGYPVDGVIAVTPKLVERLIGLTGPVELADFNLTVTADNLTDVLQTEVEENYDRSLNQPKQVIGSLIGQLVERLFDLPGRRLVEVGGALAAAVQNRDLMIAPADSGLADKVDRLNWSGRILAAPRDYLMVTETNIGGGKTDQVIYETVEQAVTIEPDGRPTAELTISREHRGDPNDARTEIANVDYVRIYVPAGSELISADGFSTISPSLFKTPDQDARVDADWQRLDGNGLIDESSGTRISQAFGKTVFANWLEVHVGEKVTARIRYRLPFSLAAGTTEDYSLLVQAQPGARHRLLTNRLSWPQNYSAVWRTPVDSNLVQVGRQLQYTGPLERDRSFGVIFEIANQP